MRLLGVRTSIPVLRWDLVYLLANLKADERDEIGALAAPIEALLEELGAERGAMEQAEDAVLIAMALRQRRDGKLDGLVIRFGGVARAAEPEFYENAFPKYNPSKTARLPLADEVVEVDRILGELATLPADHLLRSEYEAAMGSALGALRGAMTSTDQAEVALALARSRLDRYKLHADQVRLETHGRLIAILKDKAQAETFFRSTTTAPGTKPESDTDAPTPAAAPQGG